MAWIFDRGDGVVRRADHVGQINPQDLCRPTSKVIYPTRTQYAHKPAGIDRPWRLSKNAGERFLYPVRPFWRPGRAAEAIR